MNLNDAYKTQRYYVTSIYSHNNDHHKAKQLCLFTGLTDETSSDESYDSSKEIDSEDEGAVNEEPPLMELADELYLFYIVSTISDAQMIHLLSILHRHNVKNVPKSLYFLKKNSRIDKKSILVTGGEFSYFGIANNLKFLFDKNALCDSITSLSLKFNFDGLPIFRSSSLSAWPILMKVATLPPVAVALFLGTAKPKLVEYLSEFVTELKALVSYGFSLNDKVVAVDNVVFICDAPARAMVQGIAYHTSKKGCSYCTVEGESFEKRVIFLKKKCPPRLDAKYSTFSESNQLEVSPLNSVPGVSLLLSFPPEYQHLICLGVVRRICHFYFSKVKHFRLACRLSRNQIQDIDTKVSIIQKYFPREFNRKPRSFKDLTYFKASEYRTFILYSGCVLLRKQLHKKYFDNFIALHFAVYVFSSPHFSILFDNAEYCLNLFIDNYRSLFTKKACTYNFHVLSHLPQFVKIYGQLDKWSTFPFENYFSALKRRTKCTPYIFSHLTNNIFDIRNTTDFSPPTSSLFFSNCSPDNCCETDDGYVFITQTYCTNGLFSISGIILKYYSPLYTEPYSSSVLGIGYYTKSLKRVCHVIPKNKCICIPENDCFLVIPYVSNVYFG